MNDTELDSYLEAGRIAKEVLHSCAAEIKPGVLMGDIFDMVVDQTEAKGAMLSFPPNISFNNVAAHDSPSPGDERTFSEGDLIKLDIGTHIDGYIADTAVTINLGNHEKLCEASKAALEAAIKVVKPELVVSEIGAAVEEAITSYGFKPIVNLTGHAVARYDLHHGLSIPNTGLFGSAVLRKDDVIAIEPFATTGSGIVHDTPRAEIYQVVGNSPVRSPTARKIMKKAEEMNGLPFSRRWLNIPKADLALPTLLRQGNLYVYHCLADVPESFVAQFEHTMIVTEDGPLVTTR
ncbi:MAG: type II methionyl aminopeptidase [Methanocorpusculum sp.]|nr:type II methionyl aminopeptidase [Methanocorpusculum sp.]MDE2522635.1 type II methionyl aminopeptidase [Methanocorpusculum sp.]MDE2523753.1 type II methionyl aminopeptidase [Methanocorpusculum sp.]